jgi:peptidoglycan/LPS O-acetylase OafA/YrhL
MSASSAVGTARRDRYFDTLRAVAIVRVVGYHAFHFAALAVVFPSMGVMFALGGSLMAASLDRSGVKAIRSRLRRLLPGLWLMGLVLVPLMLGAGWAHRPAWPALLLWAVPLATPPASHGLGEVGAEGAGVLWYLATYLWLVLLSPLLLACYRRHRLLTVTVPLLALTALHTYPLGTGNGAVRIAGDVLTFLPCWLLGFAHRDQDLRRLRVPLVAVVALACVVPSLGWVAEQHGRGGLDLVPFPLAQALYSMGFVLALLRCAPSMAWLSRRRLLDTFVTAVNRRAVTIYLWHNVIITVAIIVGDRLDLWQLRPDALVYVAFSGLALTMLAGTVLAVGWVEDIAARRPARLWPWAAAAVTPAPHTGVPAGPDGTGRHHADGSPAPLAVDAA